MNATPPTLCLIHGHGFDATIWDDMVSHLPTNLVIIRPDISRETAYTTIDAYAEHVYAQLQRSDVTDVVLVGHSMGGYVALALAERYPDVVRGLVLFHSTAYADDDERRAARQETLAELERTGSSAFIEKTMPKVVADGFPQTRIEALITRYRTLPAEALSAGMKAIAGRPDRTQVLRNATFPILLLLGKQDQLISYEKNVQLASQSSRIDLISLDDSGHLSMVEQPAEAAQALTRWLNSTM